MTTDETPAYAEKMQESIVNFVAQVQPTILEKTNEHVPVIVAIEDGRGPNVWADYLKSNLRQHGAMELSNKHLANTGYVSLRASDGKYEEMYGTDDVKDRIAFVVDPRAFTITIYDSLKHLVDLGAIAAYYVPVSDNTVYSIENVKGKTPESQHA